MGRSQQLKFSGLICQPSLKEPGPSFNIKILHLDLGLLQELGFPSKLGRCSGYLLLHNKPPVRLSGLKQNQSFIPSWICNSCWAGLGWLVFCSTHGTHVEPRTVGEWFLVVSASPRSSLSFLATWWLNSKSDHYQEAGSERCQFLKVWVPKPAEQHFCHSPLNKQ